MLLSILDSMNRRPVYCLRYASFDIRDIDFPGGFSSLIMPPKRNNQANNEKRSDEPMNDWAELRRTLTAMQENIQTTIHNLIQELRDDVL